MLRSWLILLIAITGVAAADSRPLLSLVIDDLGYAFAPGKTAIELEGDHTYAILPDAVYSRKLAEHAHRLNKEVILHLPMQSISSSAAREPGSLNEAMNEDELTGQVHSLLESVPFIRGVNNHMGSHLTEFDFLMRPVMDSIRSYDPSFYFLDSRTSPRSVAYAQARDAGLNSITRDVFLDNEDSLHAIRLQLRIWLQRARDRGSAIAIGHPYANTLQVLQEALPEAHTEFRFLRISELIRKREQQRMAAHSGDTPTTLEVDNAD